MSASSTRLLLVGRFLTSKLLGVGILLWPSLGYSQAQCPELLENPNVVSRLGHNGLVILIRHIGSRIIQNPGIRKCTDPRRVVSAKGEKEAKKIRNAIEQIRLPVGEVLYSRTCRTQDTAELIFPDNSPSPESRLEIGSDYDWVNSIVIQKPVEGNLIAITHGTVLNNIKIGGQQVVNGYSATGLTAVFDPGRKNPLLGCMTPDDWEELAERYSSEHKDSAESRNQDNVN